MYEVALASEDEVARAIYGYIFLYQQKNAF